MVEDRNLLPATQCLNFTKDNSYLANCYMHYDVGMITHDTTFVTPVSGTILEC